MLQVTSSGVVLHLGLPLKNGSVSRSSIKKAECPKYVIFITIRLKRLYLALMKLYQSCALTKQITDCYGKANKLISKFLDDVSACK